MKHDYKNLNNYLIDNEIDYRDIDLLRFIEDTFNDDEVLHDLPTAVIKDMFVYYTKHKK